MTSPLPPRRRDSRNLADLVRQNKTNLGQLGRGFVGGRDPRIRPLGAAALYGDLEDDQADAETQIAWETHDFLILTNTLAQRWQLSHIPISESVVIEFHHDGLAYAGLTLWEGPDFTVERGLVTIPASTLATLQAAAGDALRAHYPYYVGDDVNVPLLIDFGSSGWRYKAVAGGDSTDYSGTDYDDSSWSPGQAPFADTLSAHLDGSFLPPATASWPDEDGFWVRRLVNTGSPGADHIVTIRIDDYLHGVWWNGALVHGPEAPSTPYGTRTITIPGAEVSSENLLAIKARDVGPASAPTNRTYLDAKIEGGGEEG